MHRLAGFLLHEDGASSVEYGILMAGIALVIAAGITALGQAVLGLYNQAATLFP